MSWHPDIPVEYRNQIVTGDARVLAERLPDGSVDLIFTDPVYQSIDDYRWLAKIAVRVLKPNRACLAFAGPQWRTDAAMAMRQGGLSERWGFIYYLPGSSQRCTAGFNHYVPLMWFEKGHSKQKVTRADVFLVQAYRLRVNNHRWNKDPNYVMQHIEAFCDSGDLVFDPFTGGGTISAVCKMHSRNYIAFEIDPNTADLARQRVANTQPPLFVPEPEQLTMETIYG